MAVQRFLLVDEVEANLLFFTVVLGELGYRDVLSAQTGDEALHICKDQAVHFVVAAWEMQTMPGTLLVQKLRTGKRKHIPYLIYSKRMNPEDLRLTQELGLDNVMTMPLDKEKAKSTIKRLLDAEGAISPEEQKLRKVEALVAAERPSEALRLVDGRMKQKGPFFARAQTALGHIWLSTNQLPKAEECLKAALADTPGSLEATNLLANVYSRMGRHEEAIAILQALTEQSPKNLLTLLNLGSTYVEADRHEDARKVFAAVSTIDPDNRELKDEQGKLAFKEGDLPLAAKLLAETQTGDALARHFNNLAIAYVHKQAYDKAIETYENGIKLLANKAKLSALRYNLGLALAKKGALERSFIELVASYKGDPSFEKAYAALARVSKQMAEKGQVCDKNLVREINQIRKAHKAKTSPPGAA